MLLIALNSKLMKKNLEEESKQGACCYTLGFYEEALKIHSSSFGNFFFLFFTKLNKMQKMSR